MKTFIHDAWHSILFWAFISGFLVTITLLFVLVNSVYRSQVQHDIDRSALHSVEQIDARVKTAIAEMRAEDARSKQERGAILKSLESVKEQTRDSSR